MKLKLKVLVIAHTTRMQFYVDVTQKSLSEILQGMATIDILETERKSELQAKMSSF